MPGKDINVLNADGGISFRLVTEHYHELLKIPLRAGRLLTSGDRSGAPPVVIINEAAARKYFPGEDPIGRKVDLDGNRTIVGVVGDVHQTSLETDPLAEAYVPLRQSNAYGGELLVRTIGSPYGVLPAVKSAVFTILPDVPLRNVGTMDELIARRLAQRRFSMLLLGLFGVLGLVIAAVGIYGVMAYVVAQRTREIGVRLALGATRARVVRMVLLDAALLVAIGLSAGVVASWYLSATSKAYLFQLEPNDPRTFAAAALARRCCISRRRGSARRAASVDPWLRYGRIAGLGAHDPHQPSGFFAQRR